MGWGVHDNPEPPEPPVVCCPCCSQECDTVYLNVNGAVIGCDNCIMEVRAVDWLNDDY